MKKKILYIVSTLKRSGPTNQLYNLISYLDPNEFEPYILTLSPEPAESRWSEYSALGIQTYSLGLSRVAGIFFARSRIEKLVEELQPHLIHTQGIRADVLSESLNIDLPKIATVRNFPQHDYRMTYGRFRAKMMLWKHVRAMRKLDVCIGVSKSVASNLLEEFNLHNVDTISNGVDTEKYYPASSKEKMLLRQRLGLDLGAEIWICSGHLSERKDPLSIIAAWADIFGEDNSKQLVFVGDGPLRIACEHASAGYANIRIVGRVGNVSDYLRASSYFISASKAEGLPNAVLEALACGLPVLLSDIEPHREIWEMDKCIGRLFKSNLKQSLQSAFSTDPESASKAALSLVNVSFSARSMSRRYQEVYKNRIKGKVE